MIPLVGITCGEDELNFFVRRYYINVIEAAGGVPVPLPALKRSCLREKYLNLLDWDKNSMWVPTSPE